MNNVFEMRELLDLAEIVAVKHMKRTNTYSPKDEDTWISFWEERTGLERPNGKQICYCCKEENDDFVGAHVYNINTNETYICITCRQCNSRYGYGKCESPTFSVRKKRIS